MATATAAPPQHLLALDRANTVRRDRAKLKQRLKGAPSGAAARIEAARVLRDPGDAAHSMTVMDLLCSCRQHGRAGALRVLHRVRVSEQATVGGITPRQRFALIEELGVIGV